MGFEVQSAFMADPDLPELPPIEGRKAPRKRVLLGAKIIYNDGSYSVDCRIRDLSDTGARVVLSASSIIPARVVLLDIRNSIAYEAEVVWMKSPEFGLRFLSKHLLRGQLPPQLMYLKAYAS
jgi:hypothetical protein